MSADGQRILRVRRDAVESEDPAVPNVPRIEMAQGWLQEVERRLGVR